MIDFIRKEWPELKERIRETDRKVLVIFISLAIFQTISWYFTSRRFFRLNLYSYFKFNQYVDLIEFYYWFIGDTITFLFLPWLIIRLVLKEKITINYGLTFGDLKSGLYISILFYIIMLPVLWIMTSFESFQNSYPYIYQAKESWGIFVIYEAGILLYMFSWEFIWRGFTLFGLKEKFGFYAIFIQMIPFVILHNGKPAAETFGSIIAGLALGILALRTGSMLYGFFIHGAVMLTIDLMSVLRFRTGDYGTGLASVFNIIKNL